MISFFTDSIPVIFVATWFWIYIRGTQRGVDFQSRAFARRFLFTWILFLLLNHFILGPNSFLQWADEGEIIIPWYKIVAAGPSHAQYSHRLASGFDLHGSIVAGGEFLSPNRWLIANMPLWIALLIHKAIANGVSLVGAYLLVRRGLKQERLVALALAALFSVSQVKLVLVTFLAGMSWGLLPLAAYMIVFRAGRRRYIPGVIAFAIYAALFSSPNHVLFPLAATLFGAALVARRHWGRIVIGSVLVVGVILVNWSESIHAQLQLAPLASIATAPLSAHQETRDGIAAATYIAARILDDTIPPTLFALGFIGVVIKREGLTAWAGAFLAPVVGYTLFVLLPWEILGLGGVMRASGGIYSMRAWLCLGIIAAAPAFRSISSLIPTHVRFKNTILPALAIASATVVLGHYKGTMLRANYYSSGQAMTRNISNLNDKSLWPTEPFRIVSLSDRVLSPGWNIPTAFYGLDSFDGYTGLYPRAHATYWEFIIENSRYIADFPAITPDEIPWRGIEKVSLPLLAVANVRFFISPVPVEARGLRLTSGPDAVPVVYRQKNFRTIDEKIQLYGWFARKMFQPWKVYIYEIDGALPRAYVARGIIVTDEAVSDAEFHAQVERRAPDGDIVVRAKAAERLGLTSETKSIRHYPPLVFKLKSDGFFADWQGRGAGVAVFNAVHMPFFRAFVDDTEVPVVAVNGVQMAVAVPAGARNVRLVYRRPTLLDRMSR